MSQASFQLLKYNYNSKVYNLEKHNPKLFMYLESLSQIKVRQLLQIISKFTKLLNQLIFCFKFIKNIKNSLFKMKKYLVLCKVWNAQLKNVSSRFHELLYNSNLYSIKDMVEIKSGIFLEDLLRLVQLCEKHIRYKCEVSYF